MEFLSVEKVHLLKTMPIHVKYVITILCVLMCISINIAIISFTFNM